jgi:selenide,water dikinase
VLILTKPIGSGVIFNANLKNWVSEQALEECIQTITTLNKQAAAVMADFDIHAVTDITGFGLGGHALEMAEGSGVTLEIRADDVPIMREALEMYQKGMRTGVNPANRALIEESTHFEKSLPAWHEEIFVDPQTSGGLLMSLPASQSESLLEALRSSGVTKAQIVGNVKSFVEPNHLVFV